MAVTSKLGNMEVHKRAVEDFAQFSSNGREVAKLSILANGGGLLALMTLATDNQLLYAQVKWFLAGGAVFYVFGVIVCGLAMCCYSLSKLYWGFVWENAAFRGEIAYEGKPACRGSRLDFFGSVLLPLSLVAFALGSLLAICGLLFASK